MKYKLNDKVIFIKAYDNIPVGAIRTIKAYQNKLYVHTNDNTIQPIGFYVDSSSAECVLLYKHKKLKLNLP